MDKKTIAPGKGLTLLQIHSTAHSVQEYDRDSAIPLLADMFPQTTTAVLWLDNRVEIALFRQSGFLLFSPDNNKPFSLDNVQRMRVFNQDKEFYLWRNNTTWQGRLRDDRTGTPWQVVVANQLLFGTGKPKNADSQEESLFTTITEDRGTTLHLPFKDIAFDKNGNLRQRIFIKTHNYIKANSIGQSGYVDCRFVGFCRCLSKKHNEFVDLELAG